MWFKPDTYHMQDEQEEDLNKFDKGLAKVLLAIFVTCLIVWTVIYQFA